MSFLRLAITILGLAVLSACNYSASSSSGSGGATSTSAISSGAKQEVMLSGVTGFAVLAGDKVEIKEGVVLVNGVSFGPVPAGVIVKYTMNAEGRRLLVGTEWRSALK